MVQVDYDNKHNAFIIEFEGNIDGAQANQLFSDIEKVILKHRKGFKLLTDFSLVQTMDFDVEREMKKAMELFNAQGVTEILRVLPDHDMDIGFNIMSRFYYSKEVKVLVFRSRKEAEEHLRNEKPD